MRCGNERNARDFDDNISNVCSGAFRAFACCCVGVVVSVLQYIISTTLCWLKCDFCCLFPTPPPNYCMTCAIFFYFFNFFLGFFSPKPQPPPKVRHREEKKNVTKKNHTAVVSVSTPYMDTFLVASSRDDGKIST